MRTPTYVGIVSASIDDAGNLRLYRRRRLWKLCLPDRQTVFHPRGDWIGLSWQAGGRCQVVTRRGS